MDIETFNSVTKLSKCSMFLQLTLEIRYVFSNQPYEYRILNFIKEFLDGNKSKESITW